jgi:hypothetical protein
MTQPLRDHGHRDTPKMQCRAARVPRVMQPDRTHASRRRQPVPHVRQRARRVRFPSLVASDIGAVDVSLAKRQLLLRIASRGSFEDTNQALIERQRGARRLRFRLVLYNGGRTDLSTVAGDGDGVGVNVDI